MAPLMRDGHRKYCVSSCRTIKRQAWRYHHHPVIASLGEGAAQIPLKFQRKVVHVHRIESYFINKERVRCLPTIVRDDALFGLFW